MIIEDVLILLLGNNKGNYWSDPTWIGVTHSQMVLHLISIFKSE